MLKKKLGDILVELNIITQSQLEECQQIQKEKGGLLGQIIVNQGFATQNDLGKALAIQVDIPFIENITEQMVDPQMLIKIPIKFLRQHNVVPIMFEGRKTIITADPQDLQPLDDLSLLLGGDSQYAAATEKNIIDTINKYYPFETSKEMMDELQEEEESEFDLGAIEEKDITEMANEAPIVKLVNHILFQAVKEDASDIHIEPFEKELRVRYRIDGIMYEKILPPKRFQSAIVSRIKIMSNLNIAEKRLPQDGRIQIKVANKAIDIRVSILPCNFGERVVMRLLDKTKGAQDIQNLHLSPHDLEIVTRNIERPNGIILVSGPTGSGKTTTLYSILKKLNRPDNNIITVEDPVEYTIHGVNQVQVKEDIGLTFSSALRSILRQDPDIVLIGEIRDVETAQIATQAALTGHLVLSTIHTNNAPATITRLIDMGVEPFLVASSMVCIISQRLVRRLCNKCKQVYQPEQAMLKRLNLSPDEVSSITFYKPVGCDDCLKTGYRGRLAIFEVMEITDSITRLIVQKVDSSVIKEKGLEQGMTQLSHDGIRCIKEGLTSIEEVLSVSYVDATPEDTNNIKDE
jgi:general secretion pathway protein E